MCHTNAINKGNEPCYSRSGGQNGSRPVRTGRHGVPTKTRNLVLSNNSSSNNNKKNNKNNKN